MIWLKGILLLTGIAAATAQRKEHPNDKDIPHYTLPFEYYRILEKDQDALAKRTTENMYFLNQVYACRWKHQDVDEKSFYNYLYCNITQGQYTIGTGNRCNFKERIIKKIKERLDEFDEFKGIPRQCEKNNSALNKRSLLESQLLDLKSVENSKKQYVYLGPSRFPISTFNVRVLFNVKQDVNKEEETKFKNKIKSKPKRASKVSKAKRNANASEISKPFLFSPGSASHNTSFLKLKEDTVQGTDYNTTKRVVPFRKYRRSNNTNEYSQGHSVFLNKLYNAFTSLVERFKKFMQNHNQILEEKTLNQTEEESEGKIKTKETDAKERKMEAKEEGSTEMIYYTLQWEAGTRAV